MIYYLFDLDNRMAKAAFYHRPTDSEVEDYMNDLAIASAAIIDENSLDNLAEILAIKEQER